MTKEMMTIYDMATGQELTREMTADELAQLNEAKDKAANDILAAETKSMARQALLERLGITDDEAKLLLS
jgi:hypothetical protein